MMEFMLSRLTLSLCAAIVLITLAPLMCSFYLGENDQSSCDSLEALVSRFDELSSSHGEVKLELAIQDYLNDEGDNFILHKRTLTLISSEGSTARPIQESIRIYVSTGSLEVEVEEAKLGWTSKMTLIKGPSQSGAIVEAHIENLEATSVTLAANMSTSSKVL